MNKQLTTQEHIPRIIEFRQAIHASGFGKESDALQEALDALCLTGSLASFPLLSLSSAFRREWHSLYKAIERGSVSDEWLTGHLARAVPETGVQYYSLDSTAWARPRARTMDDRQYVYQPTQAVNGGSICVGYPYSLLDWVPEAHCSWSLSVSIQRIPSEMNPSEMGIVQVKALSQSRSGLEDVVDIVAADTKYGNARFLRPLQKQNCGLVVRLRKDRVLYREPEEPLEKKPGRPRIHGARFAFKEADTWGPPDEVIELENEKFGRVKLERWKKLHGKQDADVPFDVLRASVHLERDKAPKPIWLAWQAPTKIPAGSEMDAETLWRAYVHRWPVEPGIRFRKQHLGWATPQFHNKESADRWSWLIAIAVWILFLSGPVVQDPPLPWQKPQEKLTPQRVQQSFPLIFAQFGTPAQPPKIRGKPPGWKKGRPRAKKQRYKVVKKT